MSASDPRKENAKRIKNAIQAIKVRDGGNDDRTGGKDFSLYVTEEGEEINTKERVVRSVEAPATFKPTEAQVFYENGLPNHQFLKEHFRREGRLHESHALRILRAATDILYKEPTLLELSAPINICGDIHGQYYDLMRLFELGGDPRTNSYLFLGDYVDRGSFSIECLLYLYSLKINFPNSFWMLRGNHECKHLTEYFTFKSECLHKYSMGLYEECLRSFNVLPLAAVTNRQFFCVHGGISPELKSLEDLRKLNRFREPPTRGLMCDLLWADPIETYDDDDDGDNFNGGFVRNSVRGCSYSFTFKASCDFLKRTGLISIIRAHEAQDAGYRMYKVAKSTGFPSLWTIFSAPNYLDTYNNRAAILKYGEKLNVAQFYSNPHPYWLPHFMDAFTWSLPFVGEKVTDMLVAILNICTEEELEDEVPFDREAIEPVSPLEQKDGFSFATTDSNPPTLPSIESSPIISNYGSGSSGSGVITTITETPEINEDLDPESWEAKRIALRNKVIAIGRLSRMFQVLREESVNVAHLKALNKGVLPKGSLMGGSEGLKSTISSFEEARKADLCNEALPPSVEEMQRIKEEKDAEIRNQINNSQHTSPVYQRLIRRLSQDKNVARRRPSS